MPYTFQPSHVVRIAGVTYYPRRSYTVSDAVAELIREDGGPHRLTPVHRIGHGDTTYDDLESLVDQMDDRLDLGPIRDRPIGTVPATWDDLSTAQQNLVGTYLTGGFTELQINSTLAEVRRGQLDFRVYTADHSQTSRQILTTAPHGGASRIVPASIGLPSEGWGTLAEDTAPADVVRQAVRRALADYLGQGVENHLPMAEMPNLSLTIHEDGREEWATVPREEEEEPQRRTRVTTGIQVKSHEVTKAEVTAYLTKALANTNVTHEVGETMTDSHGMVVVVGYAVAHKALLIALLSPAVIKAKEWGRIVSDPGFAITGTKPEGPKPRRQIRVK